MEEEKILGNGYMLKTTAWHYLKFLKKEKLVNFIILALIKI